MPTRRPILKRVAVWTAGVALALAGYVAGVPFVAFFAQKYVPASQPVFMVVYAPLIYVARNPNAPGHDLLKAYVISVEEILRNTFH